MPGGDAARIAALERLVRHHLQGPHAAVVGLVDMHVDVAVEPLCKVEAQAHVLALRGLISLPVRHSAHHMRAQLERRLHQLVGARVAQQALLRKRDRLHVGDVRAVRCRREHALQRHELADRVDVDMRPKPRRALLHRLFDHRPRALPHVLD